MPDLIARDNAQLLNNAAQPAEHHSFAQRLSLEANLLGGGVKDGFMDRLQQARENPGWTAVEFTAAAAIGAGLTAMHNAGGRWGVAANIAGTGLKWVAIGDVVRRGAPTAYAMADTFINPKNYAENRAIVASNLGGALFDYPLMMAGGALGSAAVNYGPRITGSLADRFKGNSAANASTEAAIKNLNPDALSKFGKVPDFGKAPEAGVKGNLPPNNSADPGRFWNDAANRPKGVFEPGKPPFDFSRVNAPKFNFDITAKTSVHHSFAPIIPVPLVEKEIMIHRVEKKEK